jgi:ribosome-associated protein
MIEATPKPKRAPRPKKPRIGMAPDRVDELLAMVLASLDDDQAVDVVSIPLAGKSTMADYMVIGSGRSGRQVASMANKIADRVKTDFKRSVRMQGLQTADWVLIDIGDIIVHLFRPEVREFYALEKMWNMEPEATAKMTPDTAPARPV